MVTRTGRFVLKKQFVTKLVNQIVRKDNAQDSELMVRVRGDKSEVLYASLNGEERYRQLVRSVISY